MSRPTTPLPSTNPLKDTLFTSPNRSSTYPVKPRHHIPHHPHRVHRHHHSRHHHHDKSVPQSAIQPTTSSPFGDFLTKTTSGLNDGTKTPPRRNEAGAALRDEEDRRERERAQWKEVKRLKSKRLAVDEDLRTTLTHLFTLSSSTTRRLDYTYYSLLSSITSLTSTLTSLHNLSTNSASLSTHFNTSSASITADISSQIETADKGFKQQAKRIEDLEGRMRKGRQKMQSLGDRLEIVKGKVEREGEREREERKRVGRRLRVLWGMIRCVGILVVGLVVLRHWPSEGFHLRDKRLVQLSNRTWSASDEGSVFRSYVTDGEGGEDRRAPVLKGVESVQADATAPTDPVLRLFDEL